MLPPLRLLALAYLLLSHVISTAAPGDEFWDSRFSLPGLDGPVNALATDGINLYAGGYFRFAGPLPVNGIAKWDGTNWSSLGNGFDGQFSITALAVSGTNVYVAGYFTSVSGVSATNVARWNGNHWSALGSGTTGLVAAITVIGSDVYFGGDFTEIGGVTAQHVARWNGTTWSPLGSGLQGYCRGLKFGGENLFANVVTNIARWDGNTWSALPTNHPAPEIIGAMEVAGEELIAGGYFRRADGTRVTTIGRWNGSSWILASGLAASPPVDPFIDAISVLDNEIYVSGTFHRRENSFDVALNGIARWNGSAWLPLREEDYFASGGALVTLGTRLYASGSIYQSARLTHKYVVGWDKTHWTDLFGQPDGLGIKGNVHAIATSGRNAYVGGSFSSAGDVNATNLARWDGARWSVFGQVDGSGNFGGSVDYIVATSNLVYVAGSFTEVDGVAAPGVAKWDGTNWSGLGTPPYGGYVAFAAQGEKAYIANSSSGAPFGPYIYEWDGTNWAVLGGGVWGASGIEVSMPVRAFAVNGNDVYIGGMFNEVGGVRATNLARWDGTNWWPVGGGVQFFQSGVGTTAIVLALAIRGHELFVAGHFNRVGGSPVTNANNIARWDGTNWFTFAGGVGGYVYALALSADELYVGGNNVARWDGAKWSALGSGISKPDGPGYSSANALAVIGADLLVGGQFSLAGDKPASNFSIWHIPQRLQVTRVGAQWNVSWPTQAVDFLLQTTDTLPDGAWSTLPQQPQVVNGRYTITTDHQGPTRFFRLCRCD